MREKMKENLKIRLVVGGWFGGAVDKRVQYIII